jgi:predicted signal transduction protein with EAL and GGDEF domain
MGDLLLQQVAERLTSCVREDDTVARLGGDEFVVLLQDLGKNTIESAEQTDIIGKKILVALGQTYQLNGHSFRCTASIGATLFNEDMRDVEGLLKQADIAMYQAKQAGRNALCFFDQDMQEAINTHAALEGELHKAIDNQQFQLYYQVQVDSFHRPVGAEALIRWIHPESGLVYPADFIPLAEESGLILRIGKWVLETACTQLKAWSRDEQTMNLVLAVNISAKQFHQADFASEVLALLQHHVIDPNMLKLELTESMLLENTEVTIATMSKLKEIGVQLSLDDFGTGYSSLQYLKRLPLDQIKIDRSFVRDITTDPNDAAIVQTIIAMTKALDLDVIAEGVETKTQREFLHMSGCHTYQGYVFGKPVLIEQFESSLNLFGSS